MKVTRQMQNGIIIYTIYFNNPDKGTITYRV